MVRRKTGSTSKRETASAILRRRVKIPGVTASIVPLDVDDSDATPGEDERSFSLGEGWEMTPRISMSVLSADRRMAILAQVALDTSAKPADRLRAVQLVDEIERRGGGERRARSLFSITREPSLADTPPSTLPSVDDRAPGHSAQG